MFIKISGIFSGKFCSKMYEPLLFCGNKRDGVRFIGTSSDHIYSSLWSYFKLLVLLIIYW